MNKGAFVLLLMYEKAGATGRSSPIALIRSPSLAAEAARIAVGEARGRAQRASRVDHSLAVIEAAEVLKLESILAALMPHRKHRQRLPE